MVLIDTWWNVNNHTLVLLLWLSQVLIDTWWNVNECTASNDRKTYCVLIDTWWNVNAFSTNEINSFASFNRYMVECEFFPNIKIAGPTAGFNRYMVECELAFYMSSYVTYKVLIDTWWNVNL